MLFRATLAEIIMKVGRDSRDAMALLIDNDVTARVLEMDDALGAIEDAFTQLGVGDAAFQPRTDIWSPDVSEGNCYCWGSLLGAMRDPPRLAFRFKSDVMRWEQTDMGPVTEKHNVTPGKYMGFILLFDTSTGELLGLLNDGVLQHVRVGATAGVACKYLARDDATTVGMVGSAGMARAYAEAFTEVRDIETIRVFSPTESHRREYAEDMSDRLETEVRAVDHPRKAIQGADIVASCTNAHSPVYEYDWIEDGQFLVNVKGGEVPDEAYTEADHVFTTTNDPYIEYLIGTEQEYDAPDGKRRSSRRGYHQTEYPTLGEVLADETAAEVDEDDVRFYYNRSAGLQFAAVGHIVHEAARERGLGTTIPLEWFQQEVRN